MAKIYFTINKDQQGTLCDCIFYSNSKTTAKNELRDKGFTPKLVLTWDDVGKVISDQFQNKDLTEEYRQFVISHEKEWESQKETMEGTS